MMIMTMATMRAQLSTYGAAKCASRGLSRCGAVNCESEVIMNCGASDCRSGIEVDELWNSRL